MADLTTAWAAGQPQVGRRLLPFLAALAATLTWTAQPAPASAWAPGACPTSDGVTVVVDFTAFGAGTAVRCAPGQPETGFDALVDAGFAIEQVLNVPGFLCRIDGRPGPAVESCTNTPPATAYWSYWHAERGGAWTYSPTGGATRMPPAGTVEGWVFVDGGDLQPPSVPPPPAMATPAPLATPAATLRPAATPLVTAAPTRTPTPTPAPPRAAPSQAADTPAGGSPTPTATVRASASAVRALRTPSATASPEAPPATSLPSVAPTADTQPAALEVAIGIGLIAVVGGMTLVVRRAGMNRG